MNKAFYALLGVLSLLTTASTTYAGAIHDSNLFTESLSANDDGSTGSQNVGFDLNFYGHNYSSLFVNNNGNITFNSPLSTYTPFGLTTNSFPIIAPFFADWDSRSASSNSVHFGQANIDGHDVFGVNWIDVGYFNQHADKTNAVQLILTNRSDTGAGNFDIQFNYDRIAWETGDASGGSNGLGGTSASVGYTDGGANNYEFAGSRTSGSFLDSNPGGLIYGSLNSNIAGQYNFQVRGGITSATPEPETYAMMVMGLSIVGAAARRKKKMEGNSTSPKE